MVINNDNNNSNNISFILSGDVLTIFLNGNAYNISTEHFNFKKIVEVLKLDSEDIDFDELKGLLDQSNLLSNISEITDGVAEYIDGRILLNGQEVHQVIADKIKQCVSYELPIDSLLRLTENIEKNPSFKSRDKIFLFLEHKGLPITDDGCFLAYKAVTSDFKDKHTGKIDNSIGSIVRFERRDVDDNSTNDCSNGLHVGTSQYTNWFSTGNDKVIIVKVNPKDVVTVPDYGKTKMRVCEYKVLYEKTHVYSAPLVTSDGKEYKFDDEDEDDDDYENFLDEWTEEDNEY